MAACCVGKSSRTLLDWVTADSLELLGVAGIAEFGSSGFFFVFFFKLAARLSGYKVTKKVTRLGCRWRCGVGVLWMSADLDFGCFAVARLSG